jgi:hypothetical protein
MSACGEVRTFDASPPTPPDAVLRHPQRVQEDLFGQVLLRQPPVAVVPREVVIVVCAQDRLRAPRPPVPSTAMKQLRIGLLGFWVRTLVRPFRAKPYQSNSQLAVHRRASFPSSVHMSAVGGGEGSNPRAYLGVRPVWWVEASREVTRAHVLQHLLVVRVLQLRLQNFGWVGF